ncbi:Sensor kinase CckA [Fundidesulfovibrio magnetotacticus]|uniref:histidine kinase n=1 Tax=Fundidesulfovibrio magnetotacticus TaxID=2730080 RepID=A0A6V8LJ46_9BACT|nr:HDOD domain-containing protein [Fundidesulfovibrio magnetotacticus]GFK92762.1 Sensor kinase CckA [Fundidesulfovibrio magnetotacticus]
MDQPDTRRQADRVRALVEGLDRLPSAPASASRLLEVAASDAPSPKDLTQAVEADPAVSVHILRLANSAEFNRAQKVDDVRQAVMLLGAETVRTAALCVCVREGLFKDFGAGDPAVSDVWRHSLACACAARMLAEKVRPNLAGAAFASGLLHDCGKLALLACAPGETAKLYADEFLSGRRLVRAEQEALGADHCLAGKWLLERWGLPASLAESAWMHHQPPQALLAAGAAGLIPLFTALADRIAHESMGLAAPSQDEGESLAAARELGLDKAALAEIRGGLGRRFAELSGLFAMPQDAAGFYFDALARANRRLGDTGLGLAGRARSQERDARALRHVAQAGLELAKAESDDAVLKALARCLRDRFGASSGLACLLEDDGRVLRGRLWSEAGEGPVRVPLDDSGAPQEPGALPWPYGELARGMRIRSAALPGPEGPPVHFQHGVATVAVRENGLGAGELLFAPGSGHVEPEMRGAVGLLAQLAAQAFRRLDLADSRERRGERLALMMRSMQEMNDKLLKTQRLAAVGQLAAGAAHEINNPLAIISARAQLLEMRESDPAKKKGLRQMVEQIDRIGAILTSLMDFARPAPPRMELMNPRECLERVLALVESGLAAQNIRLERDYAPDVPDIRADAHQMEQVLLNLALNAQHAMEEGGGVLRAGLRRLTASDAVAFTVSDTGTGITPGNLERIFDPFFTTKPEGKGTGLGLSTAWGIVTAHGGTIAVDTEPGRGSLFTVTLPRDLSARPVLADETSARREEAAVLVADDEAHIREILRESLESRGFATRTASDGEEALRLLREGRYRLLILDIRMPGRDGLSLLRESATFAGPDMPVLVLTGMATEEEQAQAIKLGAAACMRKPFQVERLLAEVERLTGRGG